VPRDGDLDERQVAHHRRNTPQILDLQHVDEFVEIRNDALGVRLVTVNDDRHPRNARFGSVPDAERFDVEHAAPEQRRNAVQHTGLVFHEYD
jgi:hypothetical protein